MRHAILAIALVVVMAGCSDSCSQIGTVITATQAAHAGATAVGPGYVDSFSVTCSTSATAISVDNQVSIECQNNSTTAVYVGDSGLTTTTAPAYCQTNCSRDYWGGNVRTEYCLVASGTQAIVCRAMVARTAAP